MIVDAIVRAILPAASRAAVVYGVATGGCVWAGIAFADRKEGWWPLALEAVDATMVLCLMATMGALIMVIAGLWARSRPLFPGRQQGTLPPASGGGFIDRGFELDIRRRLAKEVGRQLIKMTAVAALGTGLGVVVLVWSATGPPKASTSWDSLVYVTGGLTLLLIGAILAAALGVIVCLWIGLEARDPTTGEVPK